MSKIDELISKLCPEGVSFMKLRDVCNELIVPMRDRPKTFDGDIPWCRIEDIEGMEIRGSKSGLGVSNAVIKSMNLKIMPAGTVIATCSASLGVYAITTQPLITNQTFIGLVCGDKLYNRYLLHLMHTKTKELVSLSTTGTIPYISRKKFEELLIPIPPLEVQKEIVKILDKFTQLEAELSAELSAELEARRAQYEFYRNQLLTFTQQDDQRERERERDVKWLKLGDICNISRGRVMSKDYLSENAGDFPVYSSQTANNGIFGKIDSYDYDFESITWTTDGANAGSVFYHKDEKFSITNVCGLLRVKTGDVSARFLYYALQMLAGGYVNAGMGNPKLMSNVMATVKVPVPPIDQQIRAVNILDKFDSLINDLSSGLPAEINARRQQYEYYRNKLLTFQELPA